MEQFCLEFVEPFLKYGISLKKSFYVDSYVALLFDL